MSEIDNNVMPLAEDPHNLGEFDNVYEAMRRYPNGGTEDDYIYILGVKHFWNTNRQTWGILKDKEDNLVQMVEDFIMLFYNKGYSFAGIAHPDTVPSEYDGVFYIAAENGTYVNFGNNIKVENEVAIISKARKGDWVKTAVAIPNNERIDDIDSLITTIQETLQAHAQAIVGIEGDIDNLYDSIDETNQDLAELGQTVEEYKELNDKKDEEQDDRIDDVEERLEYIPKESFLSSEPACDYHEEDNVDELTADRAMRDRFGRMIDEEYLTRDAAKNYTQEVVDGSKLEIMPGSVKPEDLSPAVQEMIEAGAGKPGNITNLPDEEDLTVSENKVLKFKDKEYNPYNYSGMGRVYLRKHIVNGTNILAQHMINKPNTIYIIQYDYCLGGETIEIPENCVLQFEGGSLRNGEVVGNNTSIKSNGNNIFKDIIFEGNWCIPYINIAWFYIENNIIDNALQNSLGLAKLYSSPNEKFDMTFVKLFINKGEYTISKTIEYITDTTNVRTTIGIEFDFNNSVIKIENDLGFDIKTRYFRFKNAVIYGKEYNNNAIKLTHYNTSYAIFVFENLNCIALKIFLDTVSYNESRSASLTISNCVFMCYKPIISWVDMFLFSDCVVNQNDYNTDDCYISCRGTSSFLNSIFNPNGAKNFSVEQLQSMDRRWIDFVHTCNTNGNIVENSNLTIRDCRFGSELGAMPALYNWSDSVLQTSGDSSRCIISLESSAFGIRVNKYSSAVVLQSMPSSISFDNCFVRYSRSTKENPPLLVCKGDNFVKPDLNYLGDRIIVNNIIGHDTQLYNSLHNLVEKDLWEYTYFNTLEDQILKNSYESKMFHFNGRGVKVIAELDPNICDLSFITNTIIRNQYVLLRVNIHKGTDVDLENNDEIVSYVEGLNFMTTVVSELDISHYVRIKEDNGKILLAIDMNSDSNTDIILNIERSLGVLWYRPTGFDVSELSFTPSDFQPLKVSGVHDRFGSNLEEMYARYGQMIFNIENWTPYWKTTMGYRDAIGNPFGIKRKGSNSDRDNIDLSKIDSGFQFYDTTSRTYMFYSGTTTKWINSDGTLTSKVNII